MRPLNGDEFHALVTSRPAAAVLFDAAWDGRRVAARAQMAAAADALGDRAAFGEVNCDAEADLARAVRVANVPSVAYFRDGLHVATIVGAGQDVAATLEALLATDASPHVLNYQPARPPAATVPASIWLARGLLWLPLIWPALARHRRAVPGVDAIPFYVTVGLAVGAALFLARRRPHAVAGWAGLVIWGGFAVLALAYAALR